MLFRHCLPFLAAAALLAGGVVPVVNAATDTLNWGNLNPQYNPTPAQALQKTDLATINGNTVSIQFGTGSDAFFSNSTRNANTPASPATGTNGAAPNNIYANGGFSGKAALQIIADFDDASNIITKNAAIPVTVFFSQPVSGLMFTFYDVDSGTFGGRNYTDLVSNISGSNGPTGPAVPLTVTTTGGSFTGSVNSNVATFTATSNNAQTAAGGNASVTFGSTPITQFTFTYTDTDAANGTATHSTLQVIALSDLTFTTVPEPSTWALAGVGAVALGWLARRRRVTRTAA